jgi:tetratricopeptide (TPR) repeat protein
LHYTFVFIKIFNIFFFQSMERQRTYSVGINRIRFLKEKGRFDEAAEEIRQGLEKNPQDLLLKTSLADLYLRQGLFAEGRILAEEVLTEDPRHPQALSVLGDLYLKERDFSKALECFQQAADQDPRPYLVLKTARTLRAMGQLAKALEELDKVLVKDPENLSCLKEKALVLNRLKKDDLALEVFEKIRKIIPDDSFVGKEILRLRSRNRPPEQVLKELQTVVGMESKKADAQVHGLLAQELKKAGQVREAAAEYRQASDLEPENPFFLKQQGFCHYQFKEYEQALSCLSQAFRLQPGDYYVRGALEKSFEALGNLPGWLELLEEVSRQHPEQKALWGIIRRIRKKTGIEEET